MLHLWLFTLSYVTLINDGWHFLSVYSKKMLIVNSGFAERPCSLNDHNVCFTNSAFNDHKKGHTIEQGSHDDSLNNQHNHNFELNYSHNLRTVYINNIPNRGPSSFYSNVSSERGSPTFKALYISLLNVQPSRFSSWCLPMPCHLKPLLLLPSSETISLFSSVSYTITFQRLLSNH